MGIGFKELLIVLAVVVLLFGTKKLRNLGGDLGSALKDFRSAMGKGEREDADKSASDQAHAHTDEPRVIDQDPGETAHHTDDTASHDRTS